MTSSGTSNEPMDIAVIGAGIGGAAAAIALQQAGFSVDVFEQASQLREVGGAIAIREPSMALLAKWGALNDVRGKMVSVNTVELRDKTGTVLGTAPTAVEAGEAGFVYSVHRADLHDALIARLQPELLHLGHRLTSVENISDHAEATFQNGRTINARLIVGADGLRSIVRTSLDATPMTFLNVVTHLTIAPASLLPAELPNDRIRTWQENKLAVIMLPIRNGAEVAISAAIPTPTPPKELWSATTADELLSVYADYDPVITRLIQGRTVEITTHPIYDKEPIEQWVDRHVVLLGDAAHPMAPMNGQGANQAIQDASALATALSGVGLDDLPSALAEYQSERAPVTARIQRLSRTPPKSLSRLMQAGS